MARTKQTARGASYYPSTYAIKASHGIVYAILGDPGIHSIPLQTVTVDVDIVGHVARVTLTQTYKNDYSAPIEASYVFPVPARAAICAFNFIHEDGVKVVGTVKTSGEAKAEYEAAVEEGKTAALGEEQTKDGNAIIL
jgi:hypothetical protein